MAGTRKSLPATRSRSAYWAKNCTTACAACPCTWTTCARVWTAPSKPTTRPPDRWRAASWSLRASSPNSARPSPTRSRKSSRSRPLPARCRWIGARKPARRCPLRRNRTTTRRNPPPIPSTLSTLPGNLCTGNDRHVAPPSAWAYALASYGSELPAVSYAESPTFQPHSHPKPGPTAAVEAPQLPHGPAGPHLAVGARPAEADLQPAARQSHQSEPSRGRGAIASRVVGRFHRGDQEPARHHRGCPRGRATGGPSGCTHPRDRVPRSGRRRQEFLGHLVPLVERGVAGSAQPKSAGPRSHHTG